MKQKAIYCLVTICRELYRFVTPSALELQNLQRPLPICIHGCGQFRTDILAHLSFKRTLSCRFCNRHMHLKTHVYSTHHRWWIHTLYMYFILCYRNLHITFVWLTTQWPSSNIRTCSGTATPGTTRAQTWAKLVCALVQCLNSQFKAQVPVIYVHVHRYIIFLYHYNIIFIGLGGFRT